MSKGLSDPVSASDLGVVACFGRLPDVSSRSSRVVNSGALHWTERCIGIGRESPTVRTEDRTSSRDRDRIVFRIKDAVAEARGDRHVVRRRRWIIGVSVVMRRMSKCRA